MTETHESLDHGQVPGPVIVLTEPWTGFDPRHISSETLSIKLQQCAPGSDLHVALLREQQRRRARQAKIAAST